MKTKANPQAVILFLTGLLFSAGIFYIGFSTNRQIRSATSELNSFTEQVTDLQKSLNNAHSSYADAIQSEKDMLNWRARKTAGVTAPSQESSEGSTSSESQSSVFSQNTSPEYNSFTDDYPESDISGLKIHQSLLLILKASFQIISLLHDHYCSLCIQ